MEELGNSLAPTVLTVLFRPKVHARDLFILPTITQNRHKSEKN